MKSLIAGLAAALAAVVVLAVGSAGASASTTLHNTFSNNWQHDTSVAFETSVPYDTSSADICRLFPGDPYPSWYPGYAFSDVNLTDYIKSTWIPVKSSDGFLWRIKSVGRVEGVINAADGTYTVTSGPLKEDRIDSLDIWFFRGSGRVTISGPGGTLTGIASFTDITSDFPQEEFFVFTSIKSCNLT